jgi:hypothetical protein
VSLRSLILLLTAQVSFAAGPISFSKDIQPIFETSCWKCHGASLQMSKLDLRTRDSAIAGGEHGTALVPGKSSESRLFRHVAGQLKPLMPMDGKLNDDQIAVIKQWIDEGAKWDATTSTATKVSGPSEDMQLPPDARKMWAYQKPVRHAVPKNGEAHPIDAFLAETRNAAGLKSAPQADKLTLVRRAYLDLIGLPPTPEETTRFLSDKSPQAWENLIDRLLASERYGERWGRHWLDVARYADSNGYEHDFDRPNSWRYRDYVIHAFNTDKPYNVFLKEQLAGDELEWVNYETLTATGFLRQHAKVGFREKDNPEFRYEYLDDMIATVSRGILGLTVQCARCHNHKFDPIAQKDYYKLQATLWGAVEVDHPLVPRDQAEAFQKANAAIDAKIKAVKLELANLEQPYKDKLLPAKYAVFPKNIQEAIATPEDKRTPGQALLASQVIRTVTVPSEEIQKIATTEDNAARKKLNAQIRELEKQRPAPIPVAEGITDGDYRFTPDGPGDEPAPGKGVKRAAIEGSYLFQGSGCYQAPPSYFLIRGDVNSHGSEMQPGFVSVVTYGNPPTALPPPDCHTSGRRLALAEWLISPDNPLTARVFVNRVWQNHFGRGIVATVDNFGKMGEKPTHPELLDWLALEFQNRGWSVKQLHRLIMTSKAYQMSSQFADANALAKDPNDLNLWRFRIQRLDAEAIRDNILSVSGALNLEMGGEPVFPKLPEEVLGSMKYGIWNDQEDGPQTWRRSVYVYRKRGLPFPMFEVFDLPDQNISCGVRNISTVPTQALTLMNDAFVIKQAKIFADRVRSAADPIDAAYRLALARPPTSEEHQVAETFLKSNSLDALTHVILNLNEFLYVR